MEDNKYFLTILEMVDKSVKEAGLCNRCKNKVLIKLMELDNIEQARIINEFEKGENISI